MCSVFVANAIIEVLDRMKANEEVFTAFDVTKEARLATNDKVFHKDVRNIVNQEFRTGGLAGYDRDLCDLNIPNSPSAFVYYPTNKTAADHPLVLDNVVQDDDDNDDDNDDEVVNVTAEGRIQIPKKILDQASPVGGSYDIVVSGTVYPKVPNKDGRIRFSISALGYNNSKVKITVDNNTIQVEPV